jgi:hypothetical protein
MLAFASIVGLVIAFQAKDYAVPRGGVAGKLLGVANVVTRLSVVAWVVTAAVVALQRCVAVA